MNELPQYAETILGLSPLVKRISYDKNLDYA
ncbi:hypothetical protein C4J94_2124 [Pseudomonas sp. R5-89-07]|nr:hypothetical protein C4J94_2124 [Pseudomonas sp. R5-89-07]